MLFQSNKEKEPLTIDIHTEVDIVEARQKGRMFSNCLGFSTLDQARIITAISELSRNIYKYATTGKIIMEIIENQLEIGLKIIAIDKGPGIKNIQKAMESGYTTSGGLGIGLSGVKKLMDEFTISSQEDHGVNIEVIKWKKRNK
ncbi:MULTISPECIES: ATP-binding protein [Priestia]|uniref:ATP-binding protein n=1 Tax=Priestia TaxID=2800373 RepID=UPI000BF80786|nr:MULTISPECIES: ATP-binding protein [Priestia]MBK0006164.1 serine/threonine protein kinase [Bacillus sp. S35]MCM3254966.1 ATP-binding protein [Priestia aryabhattai]MCM3639971.1 ATP-binding protein [Priestia aryabhattai]PFW72032.1 serine/threonine protein kinase [Priestia aryabhattai]